MTVPPATSTTDRPPPAEPAAANGLGLASFICSLVGLVSCGLLSPVGLLLAVPALFIRPRAFAVAGLVVGAFGTFWLLIAAFFRATILGLLAIAVSAAGMEHVDANLELARLKTEIRRYQRRHGALPPTLGAIPRLGREARLDPWDREYRYTVGSDGRSYSLSSDGPDGLPGTEDDIRLPW